jgi:N-acyl-D-amino-acid deacylase
VFSLKSYLPFDTLPAWRALRELPLEEQKRRLADPEVRRRLVSEEAKMKPRDSVLQGGGAATTDPRKPDYDNLYPMFTVDWDDPSVADLARQSGKHPVETSTRGHWRRSPIPALMCVRKWGRHCKPIC